MILILEAIAIALLFLSALFEDSILFFLAIVLQLVAIFVWIVPKVLS
jgi:hypothetical protein